jgi:hypothetical protein
MFSDGCGGCADCQENHDIEGKKNFNWNYGLPIVYVTYQRYFSHHISVLLSFTMALEHI